MRVVTDDGTENEVLDTRGAIMKARTAGMDLIEVSPNADPPGCRVGDYGQLTYETAKRDEKGNNRSKDRGTQGDPAEAAYRAERPRSQAQEDA